MPCRRPDPDVLAALRARIGAIECGREDEGAAVVPVGAPAIDGALPGGGLANACLHEVVPANAAGAAAAASGFAAALLGRFAAARPGFLLWCLTGVDLYAPALARFGIPHDRLIVVRARRRDEVLWVLEEALRAARLAAVVGEVDGIDLTASRRLQLAARAGGTACLLLRGTGRRAKAGKETSAAVTRWGIAPAPASTEAMGMGPARWRLGLLRCRGGRPQEWLVDWDDATHRFAVVPALGDRAPVPARRTG